MKKKISPIVEGYLKNEPPIKPHFQVLLDLTKLNTNWPDYATGHVFVVYEIPHENDPAVVARYVKAGVLTRMGVVDYDTQLQIARVYTFPGKQTDRIWREAMLESKGYMLVDERPMIGWFEFANVYNACV
jgi:hypothetical protein